MKKESIFLYGPPGSGKSSAGLALAKKLHRDFIDLDALIEEKARRSIPEIFKQDGEKTFRVLETAALKSAAQAQKGAVIALGGGALLAEENQAIVNAAGQVICLTAPYETLLSRLQQSESERPLVSADLPEKLKALLAAREVHYRSFKPLDIQGLPIEAVADAVLSQLGLFHVTGMGEGYDVLVLEGLLDDIGAYFTAYGLKGTVAVVSDENVAPHYLARVQSSLERAGYKSSAIILPPGEEHKTIDTVGLIWEGFLKAGLERGSTVLALGGGVVSDMAGFAAATYKRGVSWVVCPTSLLAMVDAGIGGKTGADLPAGKNLIGAFHAPRLILTDPTCLATLPDVEIRNGMGEVIKHGVIANPDLFALCKDDWQADLTRMVTQAMAVKIKIICEDPHEKGRRAVLNLGHTIGHALELVSGFQLKHGEAVGLGMLAEAQIAEDMGLVLDAELVESIFETLLAVGLPVYIPADLDLEAVMASIQHDKKRADGVVRFALPLKIGDARIGYQVRPNLIRTVLKEMQVKE